MEEDERPLYSLIDVQKLEIGVQQVLPPVNCDRKKSKKKYLVENQGSPSQPASQ